jgi:hypothetical protein
VKVSIRCICGKATTFEYGNGRPKVCPRCGASVRLDGATPVVRIPEDSVQERKDNGSPVILKRPTIRAGRGNP